MDGSILLVLMKKISLPPELECPVGKDRRPKATEAEDSWAYHQREATGLISSGKWESGLRFGVFFFFFNLESCQQKRKLDGLCRDRSFQIGCGGAGNKSRTETTAWIKNSWGQGGGTHYWFGLCVFAVWYMIQSSTTMHKLSVNPQSAGEPWICVWFGMGWINFQPIDKG